MKKIYHPDLSSNESSFPFGCLFICSMPRTLSAGRLSHMLLKAAYGTELFEMGSDDSLNSEKSMEATGKERDQQDRTDFCVK